MSSITLQPQPSALDEAAFLRAYGDVYEHSPWVAQRAFRAGLGQQADTPDGLAAMLGAVLASAPADTQLEVIRAHPDLAGKAAVSGELTADSTTEQAGAGLDQCTPEEFDRFQRLNDEYRRRFGFPFVMAVRGHNRHDILAAFEARLRNSPEEERRTAIEQINRIALLRLRDRAGADRQP
ncbi:MAG TPA: 2-oxo-4-hydroxy-4-carboxy-5-ureidoimidazoline decarboxylase [Gammaproteobacteria bacterium]|nr:2-oxo-4-hydroxy-4-carboxy-5-ureidoimidazoline decarboxylase [Gammaproteobacteria bacterium]